MSDLFDNSVDNSFESLFDFDGDGELNALEHTAEFDALGFFDAPAEKKDSFDIYEVPDEDDELGEDEDDPFGDDNI